MATLQSGKCFTVPTFFGMCCRSEWQERMYIYKWHEVDQTKHDIFCVHIVCNEIQVKVNLEITTFFFYLRFPYCPNFFWFGVVYIYIYIYMITKCYNIQYIFIRYWYFRFIFYKCLHIIWNLEVDTLLDIRPFISHLIRGFVQPHKKQVFLYSTSQPYEPLPKESNRFTEESFACMRAFANMWCKPP